MSATASFWTITVVVAVGTFLMRSLPLWTHGRAPMPAWLDRLLKHVPAAALTALVIPGTLYATHAGTYELAPERIIAGVAALVVALRFRNMLTTLIVGMGTLWIAQVALAAIG